MGGDRHFSLRLNVYVFCIFAVFSILVLRLAYLQFVEGDRLQALQKMTVTVDSPIAPIRGNIYDRNYYPIATTDSVQSLFYQAQAGTDRHLVVSLARKVADTLRRFQTPGSPAPTAEAVIERMDVGYDLQLKPTKEPYYYASPRRIQANIPGSAVAYLSENRDSFPGFEIREETIRRYDSHRIAVHLIGYLRPYNSVVTNKAGWLDVYRNRTDSEYLNDEYVGQDGLEFLYQDELRGKNGHRIYPVNSLQQIVGPVQVVPPQKGHNLILTIQKDVQLAAQQAIREHLAFMASPAALTHGSAARGRKAKAGYAVAMEVKTGAVVAMASYPDYDPNIWRDGLSKEEWRQIQHVYTNGTIQDRAPDVPERELAKHPSSMVPPGSSIKPATVLFGLNQGLISPFERYQDTGTFQYGSAGTPPIHNSDGHAYGNITAAGALQYSSNTFMSAMIGDRFYMSNRWPQKVKLKMWDKTMKRFGLGAPTQSGLPGESNGVVFYDDTAKTTSLQAALVLASFGQQAKYTTLQLAQYAATLANHGVRMKPQFVETITDYDNHVLSKLKPVVLNRASYSAADWRVLSDGMSKVFVDGFDGVNYTFLRKTGTSQSSVGGQTVDNAVFIAYAPADHPKLAVAVVVPEGGFGSWGAAPIARKIFDAYDAYVGLGEHGPRGAGS